MPFDATQMSTGGTGDRVPACEQPGNIRLRFAKHRREKKVARHELSRTVAFSATERRDRSRELQSP